MPDPASTVSKIEVQQRYVNLPPCRTHTRYFLQLPPEYHPGRPYPLLIVLHTGGQLASGMLEKWSYEAGKNGYILAAPEWGAGLQQMQTTITFEQHEAVLDTLRDIRQRYRVDADRVFLSGCGDGASVAADIGMSHPDLFAGVSTMGAVLTQAGA